jgi:FkbH-like protein
VSRFVAGDRTLTLQFRLIDRFGDNGLVSAMILCPDANAPDVLEIDTWVMSCRVFGRQLEIEAMNIAVEAARLRGARSIRAVYLPTPRNGVVSALYPDLGFIPDPRRIATGGGGEWLLQLSEYVPRATYITRKHEVSVG